MHLNLSRINTQRRINRVPVNNDAVLFGNLGMLFEQMPDIADCV